MKNPSRREVVVNTVRGNHVIRVFPLNLRARLGNGIAVRVEIVPLDVAAKDSRETEWISYIEHLFLAGDSGETSEDAHRTGKVEGVGHRDTWDIYARGHPNVVGGDRPNPMPIGRSTKAFAQSEPSFSPLAISET